MLYFSNYFTGIETWELSAQNGGLQVLFPVCDRVGDNSGKDNVNHKSDGLATLKGVSHLSSALSPRRFLRKIRQK